MKGYFRKRGSKWSFSIDIGRDPGTGKRKQKTVSGFKTKKEAEKACAEMIAQIENNQYIELSQNTFGAFLIDFMETRSKQMMKESTFYMQMSIIKQNILPELGHIKLKDLKPIRLQKFYKEKLDSKLSPNYIRTMHSIIRKALKAAVEWNLVQVNTASLAKAPRPQTNEITTWTIEQANYFLEAMKGSRNFIIYVLAIYTLPDMQKKSCSKL